MFWRKRNHAFVNGCTSLYSVKFEDGDSKLSVGFSYDTYDDFYGLLADPLFRDCPLEKVYIGRDITGYKMAIDMLGSVTASPFENQPKLTDVIIGNTVTTIGTRLFWECTGLTSISISNSVTTIESNAFTGCTGLTSISIPNSVTSLNLSGLSNLSHITIPNSVTAFDLSGCTNLNSIELQDGISIIGKLSNCTALTSITIPSSVQSIVSDAFKDCTGLGFSSVLCASSFKGSSLLSICSLIIENCKW